MAAPQMQPIQPDIALFPPFIARQTETLVLKEKVMSLSGDSFEIKTIDGRPIFQVKGEAFSLSGRKHVMDMSGNLLFDIRKKLIALHTTFYAEDKDEREIFQVKSKFTIGRSKAVGTFQDPSTGKEVSLLMKGSFFDRKADITNEATDQPVATIDRQFLNMREIFAGQQTYALTVAPGVDMALMVAMCICLDEKQNEGS